LKLKLTIVILSVGDQIPRLFTRPMPVGSSMSQISKKIYYKITKKLIGCLLLLKKKDLIIGWRMLKTGVFLEAGNLFS
jgi:hypothetical protein